ncbi:hypothetical protein MMC18_001067 [Xylographa bjoerkii]|nr:hypothetical protein [Xylographa bjoerkii]
MKVFRASTLFSQSGLWTCRACLHKQKSSLAKRANYASEARRFAGNAGKRKTTALVAASGTAGGAVAFFTDDVKYGYGAVERSGRVLTALGISVNDYRLALKEAGTKDEQAATLKACHKRCAERVLRVCEQNGSIFIKLGQHLSSMNYLLPIEWTETFIPLQDHCPVSSYESVQEMFIKDTGYPITNLFDEFDEQPIGSASLAQVHIATMKDTGQKVAVKVQHPALEQWVPLDMALTRFSFATLKYVFPDYDLTWLSDEMEFSLPQELDFALEGQNATHAKEYFKNFKDAPLVIPSVIRGMKRILVMEYLAGHRLDDLQFLDSNMIDRDEVSAALARIFNEMIFGDGAPLHCDPHGGNLAIRTNSKNRRFNFDIILYDHGLYREIPKQLQRDYAKLWLAVIDADEKNMRKYAREVAGITDEQFPLFASAITGRDYRIVTKSVVSTRSDHEKDEISDAFGGDLLQQLVKLLGSVPRIILLILKTNDLTRSLDENLHTRQGPMRTFMILARYCSRTVFEEQMEIIGQHGNMLWPRNLLRLHSMEEQVERLVKKIWGMATPSPRSQQQELIAFPRKAFPAQVHLSFPPPKQDGPELTSSGKTTLATQVTLRLNALPSPSPSSAPIAAFLPMDGYHLSRAQLSALPDPATAHARRGAEFTFDGTSFLGLVRLLRSPLTSSTPTYYGPSFDHAVKDPVVDDIAIPATARIIVFEGNYLSLNKSPWKEAAELMDELWFVDVTEERARERLVERHVRTGVAGSKEEAERRAEENDLVNGRDIVAGRVEGVSEVVVSWEDEAWRPGGREAAG